MRVNLRENNCYAATHHVLLLFIYDGRSLYIPPYMLAHVFVQTLAFDAATIEAGGTNAHLVEVAWPTLIKLKPT
jgi:hypothetical protein